MSCPRVLARVGSYIHTSKYIPVLLYIDGIHADLECIIYGTVITNHKSQQCRGPPVGSYALMQEVPVPVVGVFIHEGS